MKSVTKALALLVLSLIAACSGADSKDGRLLGADRPTDSEEADRIRKKMAVRVVSKEAGGQAAGIVEEWRASHELFFALNDTCEEKAACTPPPGCSNNCQGRLELCKADILLAAAKDEATGIELVPAEDRDEHPHDPDAWRRYELLPQSTATKVDLADTAINTYFAAAMAYSGVFTLVGCVQNLEATIPEGSGGFVEAFYGFKDATEVYTRAVMAVSDAERSSTPSKTLAAARAVAQDKLSRAALAHRLIGGMPGLRGSQESVFCGAGPLSGPAQAALKVLRETGIAPEDLFNANILTQDLLNGSSPEVSQGSVRERLFERWEIGESTGPNDPGIQDYYRLDVTDFDQAREYLKQEIVAFARSRTATLLPEPGMQFQKFAATASVPPDREDSFFSAIAATDCGDNYCPCAFPPCPTAKLGANGFNSKEFEIWRLPALPFDTAPNERSVAGQLDKLLTRAHTILDNLSPNLPPTFRKGLGTIQRIAEHASERPYRLLHCSGGGAGFVERLILLGATDTDHWIVKGEEALEILTHGTVEGAPPSDFMASLFDNVIGNFGVFGPVDRGFKDAKELVWSIPNGLPETPERWYVVRPRAGGNGDIGEWEAVFGFVPYGHRFPQNLCRDMAIVPELERLVKEALSPDREQCAESRLSCAGSTFDERMPLEDELSSDSDDIESSWKHYLSLADQAAKESDLLGQEYIRAALDSDRNQFDQELREQGQQEKAAAKLNELQELCGTAIDPAPLVEAISELAVEKNAATKKESIGNYSLGGFDLGPCPNPDDNDPETTCVAGRNTIEWLQLAMRDPRLSELRQCVQSMGASGRVHLGTVPVCIFPGTDGNLCSGKPADEICPDLAFVDNTNIEDGNDAYSCHAGWTIINNGLRYFDTAATMPPEPTSTMCGAIRTLRKDPADSDGLKKLEALIQSNVFHPDNMSGELQFYARYLTHGVVFLDGSARWSTGSGGEGPQSTRWPCFAPPAQPDPPGQPPPCRNCAGKCAVGDPGLFCKTWNCTDRTQRALAIERIVNAVAAAQLIKLRTGDPIPSIGVPGYVPSTFVPPNFQTVNVTDTGQAFSPVRVHKISEAGAPFFLGDAKGSAFSSQLAVNVFAREAWRLPNGTTRDVMPATPAPGQRFVVIHGLIGQAASMFDPFHALVPYDARAKFFGGMSQWQADPGYFVNVLRGTLSQVPFPNGYTATLTTRTLAPITSFLPPFNLDRAALLDGLEMLCEIKSSEDSFNIASCGDGPPDITSLDELPAVSRYLDCMGRSIQRRGALTVLAGFPQEAMDALRQSSPVGNHGAITGTLGEQYSNLRSALLDIAAAAPGVGREISGLARDMEDLRTTVAMNENTKKISNLQFWSTVADRIAQCAESSISAENTISFGARGVVACANSVAQIGFASEINRLSQANTELATKLAQNDFNERFANRVDALEDLSLRITQAVETVDGELIAIENSRKRAQRVLGEALWLLSNESKTQAKLSSVLAKGKETAKVRYLKAFDNAKRMGFLAKRAVEQRLGVHLSEMTEKLPLVEAPASWEGTLCARSGINYEDLAEEGGPTNFADAFIGDYVQDLKNVVESYRLEFNFHEGSDTAVVSLRDDIHNVRAVCDTESKNLLYFSSRLDEIREPIDPNQPSWFRDGCRTTTSGGATFTMSDCVAATIGDQRPFVSAALEKRSVPGYTLRFGEIGNVCNTATCGWQAGAGLVQQLTLPAGLYRFSWYTPDQTATGLGARAGFAKKVDGTNLKPASTSPQNGFLPGDSFRWSRPFFTFELTAQTDVKVGFRPENGQAQQVVVAAPMLEVVESTSTGVSGAPKAFTATSQTRIVKLPLCEDTHGEVFRLTQWHRQCVKLCPDGFASTCASEAAMTQCYRETSFNITQRGIESGGAFVQAGFARGNFNYRIDSLALNFVGTGIRNCEDEPLSTTCHGAGYVTYTVEHQGPYLVRNHFGLDFDAKLFPGRIEHARGLGTERYLTNPLSSADSELIGAYLRGEFKGRPLDGNFVLRVWEEPGMNFDAIEDVQILLKYRYWTRFQ